MTADASIPPRRARVSEVRPLARDVLKFDLVSADGRPLPAFEAGAHIDVHVPSGPIRQYSLCGSPQLNERYSIAVKKEPAGRGGSLRMHEALEVGSILGIGMPRNNFPLVPGHHRKVLIAGGIGITPIHSMIMTLHAADADWELHYCARSQDHAVFYDELKALSPERVRTYFSEAPVLDVAALVRAQSDEVHIYCCGPESLMTAVKTATERRPEGNVHCEWFTAPTNNDHVNEAFEVELKRSGQVLAVPADQSILHVLREHGVMVPSVCEEGICGTCEIRVLSGAPDHRDVLLSSTERAANKTMMICVSRAKGSRLVLDI
jgi:vanillate O-demethylase ferredoxin subunit